MELENVRAGLLSRKGTVEETPFGPSALVYKVMGKMWALLSWESNPLRVNLKCDPGAAEHLRNIYSSIKPGYHMNKKHWNTIILDGEIPEDFFWEMADDSYNLVVKGLKKTDREKLNRL